MLEPKSFTISHSHSWSKEELTREGIWTWRFDAEDELIGSSQQRNCKGSEIGGARDQEKDLENI